ncbi:NAD(P)H-binding protein [Paenibacillus sp. IB182496]|uniref:NAD(P)H-binding protein n=1 Tax=Paenibacillus sabuli TaxID=2772509 RepID=A0A927GUW5_9BACL|nr:NAD(P)H-binding protein [Paenibacillus sabuli]MBD2848132.1 NAD(P)H-binding protein [Paenibacillus sabuli]
MSIMITGATGKLGGQILDLLQQRRLPDAEIAAGVRRPELIAGYTARDLPARHCDYDLPETLKTAFAGISCLMFVSSPHPDDEVRLQQHRQVVKAAREAGVGQIVYTSFAYAERASGPPAPLHLATERFIREAGLSYTVLRNALYTDIVGAFDLQHAVQIGRLEAPPGDWRFNAVDRRDLAEAAAAVLAAPQQHRGASYELTCPRAWSLPELADAVTELTGAPVSVHTSDVPHWIFRWLQGVDTRSVSSDLERLIGRTATPLRTSLQSLM